MRKYLAILIAFVFIAAFAFAQQQQQQQQFRSYIPEKISVEMEKALTAKSGNGVYSINIFRKADYFGQQGNVYEVVFFRMNLEEKKEAEKEKKEEAPLLGQAGHHLFLRIYKQEGGKVFPVKEYNAPVNVKGGPQDFYTFAFAMPPGKYVLVVAVVNSDYSTIGTGYFETELPVLRPGKKEMRYSTPIFIKEVKQLLQPEVHFTVVKNAFYFGQASIYPYPENVFKASEQPTLFFQLYGIGMDPQTRSCNAEAKLEVKKNGKTYVKYKKVKLLRPGMFQPLIFKKKDKPFEEGDYELEIKIKDKLTGKKVNLTVPFKIVK